MELDDLTPLSAKESWETWILFTKHSRTVYYGWNQWMDLWRVTWDKYWDAVDKELDARRSL